MKIDDRKIEDFHIVNLDAHAQKVMDQINANAWKLLNTPVLTIEEMRELHAENSALSSVLQWFGNIKHAARPPAIVHPNQGNGMRIVGGN